MKSLLRFLEFFLLGSLFVAFGSYWCPINGSGPALLKFFVVAPFFAVVGGYGFFRTESFLNLVKFIVIGPLFAAVGEYWFSYIIRGDFRNWLFTLWFNPAYVVLVYFTSRIIFRAIRNKFAASTTYYLVYGFAGLIVIEWFLVGNSPWKAPQANQLGMFSYHATTAMTSLIFTDSSPNLAKLKKAILAYFIPYSIAGTVIGFLLPTYRLRLDILVWAVIIGYTVMHAFYIWYLILVRQGVPEAPASAFKNTDSL